MRMMVGVQVVRTCVVFGLLGMSAGLGLAQTGDRVEGLLQRLADAAGPPGAEEPVRAIMVGEMRPLATEAIRYDGMGSVIAQQGKTGPRIMIDAHMDELGGMVRRITPNGFLTMQMLGGWLDQALVDQRWIISFRRRSGRGCFRGTSFTSISGRKMRRMRPRWGCHRVIRWFPMLLLR